LENKANRTANDVEYLINQKQSTLDFKLRKVDIVLNSQSEQSNGYVTTTPYHSMFFLTPPLDANMVGTQDWVDGLAAHEYRHVWQFNQMQSDLCNFFYFLMGDRGWGGYTSLVFPDWYFEGDAVKNETAFTESGRGRLPYFSLTERAMSLDSVEYSYMKVRNGSYIHLLPNRYSFGYNLLAHGQQKYGEDTWRRVVKRASDWSGLFFPFANALKKETGADVSDLYKNMRTHFNQYTREQAAKRDVSSSQTITRKSTVKSNYYQSCFETDSTLLVLKSSFKDILAFYRLNTRTGKETKLHEVGEMDYPCFSYANGTLAWAEPRHDKRWGNKGFYIVKKLNVNTNRATTLTKNTRYFSPALSADGTRMAVVEYTETQECCIKFIDATGGHELPQMKPIKLFGDSLLPSNPVFSENGNSLVFILKKKGRLALAEYRFNTEQLTLLTNYTANAITNPVVKENRVYFSSSIGGQDDIFYIEKGNKSIYRVTNSRVGAFYPALSGDGQKIVFSNFTLNGFNLQQMPLSDANATKVEVKEPAETPYFCSDIYTHLLNISDSVHSKNYKATNYNQNLHALNFHSWGPMASNNTMGLELVSNNVLNNVAFTGGWFYNTSDRLSYTDFNLYYSRFYPVLVGRYLTEYYVNYTLNLLEGDIMFPFDYSTPALTKGFTIQGGPLHENFSYPTFSYWVNGVEGTASAYWYKKTAQLQVAPQWGFSAEVIGKKGTANSYYKINEVTAQGEIYLPGLLKTHAASVTLARKTQTLDGFFLNSLVYARGFSRPDSAYTAYNKLGLNYQLPLCYPEIGINGLFFLQRIRLNLFADFAQATFYSGEKENYKSAGTEFYFDIKWFNSVSVPVYIRYARTLTPPRQNSWELGASVVTF
jgi:hypothetical protein